MNNKDNKQRTIAIFMVIIFSASIFVAATGYFTSSNNSQSTNGQQGNNQQSQTNNQSEIQSYKERLANNPDDVQAMIGLGNVYYDQKNYNQAIKYYEKSLEFEPNNVGVLVDLGTAHYYKKNSNPNKAIEAYNKALKVKPNFKNALFNKAVVIQYGLKDHKRAIKIWEDFLAKHSNSQLADKARQLLTEAKNASGSSIQNNNSRTDGQSNKQQSMINRYKEKLGENPQDVQAMIGLGNIYYDQQNYQKAINYYETSLKFESNNPEVLVDLGTAYYYKDDSNPEEALKLYNRALEIDPTFKNALFNKGVVLQQGLKDYQKATKAWQSFLAEYPEGKMANKVREFLTKAKNSTN